MDFDHYPQPASNDSSTVAAALDALRNACDELSATDACDAFLWAVGNNHSGTFYPVVLGTLAEIKEILVNGPAWAQRATMESLIDLGGTFVPQAGHLSYQGVIVQDALREFIQSLRPCIAPWADAPDAPGAPDARASSAIELLELMADRAP